MLSWLNSWAISDCLSSSRLKTTSRLGWYFRSIASTNFRPKEPVPPVISTDLLVQSTRFLFVRVARILGFDFLPYKGESRVFYAIGQLRADSGAIRETGLLISVLGLGRIGPPVDKVVSRDPREKRNHCMRIVFVENRLTTLLWKKVGLLLAQDGDDIHWMVQNPAYDPGVPRVHRLRLCRKGEPSAAVDPSRAEILRSLSSSDRSITIYGGSHEHYPHYWEQIRAYLQSIRPDVVIGEATLFHELLTVAICKELEIPYLNPSSMRYPTRRFGFHLGDSLRVVGGDETAPASADLDAFITNMRDNRILPDYMAGRSSLAQDLAQKLVRVYGFAKNALGYVQGEIYNTPSPWSRVQMARTSDGRIRGWERLAASKRLPPELPRVLYPLQLQPESNIDVWGKSHRDQTSLIREMAVALSGKAVLVIKSNPKWKFEVTQELMDLMSAGNNIAPIPRSEAMAACLAQAALVVTVTGTIALECVIKRKPVVVLAEGYLAGAAGVGRIGGIPELGTFLEKVLQGEYPFATDTECRAMISERWTQSYRGVISDPSGDMRCLSKDNVLDLAAGVRDVLKKLSGIKVQVSQIV
jgi:hypothetical protein